MKSQKHPSYMKFFQWVSLIGLTIFLLAVLAGCVTSTPVVVPTATVTLNPPDVRITKAPSYEGTVRSFMDSWKANDLESMYTALSSDSQESITKEEFLEKYNNLANEAAIVGLSYDITPGQTTPQEAEIGYQVALQSAIFGDLIRDGVMKLKMEQGEWRIVWEEQLVLPEMAGGNYLALDRESSGRATIYDRNGNPLAAQVEAAAIGVIPDYVDLEEARGLLSMLSGLTNYRGDTIANMIANALPGAYIPLGEVPVEENSRRLDQLSAVGSVITSRYNRRLYYGSGIAPHVVGYVSAIQQEELGEYRRKGYLSDDRVGRKGIEQWGEETLVGKPGGTLYLFNPEGKPIAELGQASSISGQDIYTTIDRDFQAAVQKAMSVYNGAVVVIERDTGRILAMASSPGFDPNAFETDNYNWNTLLSDLTNDPNIPQFNRATQGQYPLGSVFKLVTLAAALESGRYDENTTYECGYTFDELAGFTRYDWTYEHFKEDGVTQPSGLLTLPQSLIKSCNPYYWHIGLDLYNAGLTGEISKMARSFGLGSKTGIDGVDEEAGNIPDPGSPVDAINIAIGQGDVLVTPLQVARFVAALGNGGTLYRPQLVEKIVSQAGATTFSFKPEEQGKLPIKPANLKLIQEAMKGVVSSEKPRGTAYREINGLDIPVAGKTGTATSPAGEPHAWFSGYSFAEQEGKPDIAIAVIAENAGEGSEFAAPIFRRVIELYFYGRPLKVYKWEATFDVTRSPTPVVTDTPTPQPNLNP